MDFTTSRATATMGFIAPHATAAAAKTSAAITAAATTSAAETTRTFWRVGTIACVCFRCGQPGHFYAECRAVPPAPLNACPPPPYNTPQDNPQANYSAASPEGYVTSSGEYGHQMPTMLAPQGTPAPSDSPWSFSTERAVMTQFCPPGESVDMSGFVSGSSVRIIPTSLARSQHNRTTIVAIFG